VISDLEFFRNEILGELGWSDDEPEPEGDVVWAKAQLRRLLETKHISEWYRLAQHVTPCPKCGVFLTSLYLCPRCGTRYELVEIPSNTNVEVEQYLCDHEETEDTELGERCISCGSLI
jgi:hypothetical protein